MKQYEASQKITGADKRNHNEIHVCVFGAIVETVLFVLEFEVETLLFDLFDLETREIACASGLKAL